MELHEVLRRRAMCRSFSAQPVDPALVDQILEGALSAPTAGNTGGTSWVVLEGADQTAVYWDTTTDEPWQARNAEWSGGLMRAPVVLLAYASPEAYVERYAEPDKSDLELGAGPGGWPVPYWYGDAAFGVMAALLGAVDAGLGACVLGAFRGIEDLGTRLGVPPGWQLFCAVPLGHPDGQDHRSRSLRRPARQRSERLHRGAW
ncbi:MAG TPA: nitroreductase family protein [Acidimicrobiales bacterium]|jgi:nitroreductase